MANGPIPPISAPLPQTPQSGQVVQIVTLPEALQNNARPVRLEGEVIAQNKDGTTRIRTAEGDIDLAIKGRQPQVGQRMDVEIPAGSPPQKATVRPHTPQAQQPQPQPNTSTGQTPDAKQPLPQTPVTSGAPPKSQNPTQSSDNVITPRPTTGSSTPVITDIGTNKPPSQKDGAYQTNMAPAAHAGKPSAAIPALAAGQIYRLTPLPLTGQTSMESSMAPQTAKLEMQASIAAKNTQTGLLSSLLQTMKSSLPSSVGHFIPGANLSASTDAPSLLQPTSMTQQATLEKNFTPAPLEALITSIKSPSGQTQIVTPSSMLSSNAPTPVTTSNVQSAPPSPQLIVTVIGMTPQKTPIISIPMAGNMPAQNFALQAQIPALEVGAQITLAPHIAPGIPTTPVASLPPAWRAALPLMQPSSLWPAMDDIFQTFAQTTPQAAQILGRVIPSPANAASLGPAILLFAAALKSGDLQAWMGDKKLDLLQKLGKASSLSSLSGETSSLSGKSDAPATEWRSLPIPMLWQNEISKVVFHVRQEPKEDGAPEGETATRFVFDLDLTRMGAVQLDGLVRGNRIDLIVRTKENISTPMQEAMKKAYADALDGTQIYGELGFQGDLKNWMVTTKETALGFNL